jgi:hypothetical protein
LNGPVIRHSVREANKLLALQNHTITTFFPLITAPRQRPTVRETPQPRSRRRSLSIATPANCITAYFPASESNPQTSHHYATPQNATTQPALRPSPERSKILRQIRLNTFLWPDHPG